MINKENLKDLLTALDFKSNKNVSSKYFPQFDAFLKVDFEKGTIIYPEDKGLIINERQTCDFSKNENFVVFECVHRLLEKGYAPQHIELEPKWKSGRGSSGGRADILIKNHLGKPLLIIECKTAGKEFDNAWKDTLNNGAQILAYADRERTIHFVALYASDFSKKQITFDNYLITLNDVQNEVEKDADKEIKRLFYKDITDVNQWYEVWRNTYNFDHQKTGIFEDSIQAYNIGQQKLTLKDLQYVTGKEMQSKFNEFADILRKHNVSSKESAFDKLINLFLCKIVDETESHRTGKELEFYWKGNYFDDYFSLIDRLQRLYKEGMQEYLGEKIAYVENKQIIDGFGFYKNDRNATRDYILKLFKEQKYFTNSNFGFIEVHNDKLFYQNSVILLDIIRMWQYYQLNGEQQNQFLGDMFEGFLDKGFKQSEGQFFTPIPICKFILQSLPLSKIIKNSPKPPKVIDYACGSGHFLTEYAAQIKPFMSVFDDGNDKSNPVQEVRNIKDYYQNIFGVEKEYRLSKVAKISAFMYGQDEINIIYCDALNTIQQEIKNKIIQVEEDSCDILVANPPFAVDGFLSTLPQDKRTAYTLFTKDIDIKTQRNIQCFFLERAKQLLAPNGVTGIIVPSSVLSNSDAIHVQTRELLLKHFDFVAIAELGSGTFGKTGTNTVVLFLRRKAQKPEQMTQYWNRTQDFFDDWSDESKQLGAPYADVNVVKKYCQHINISFDNYQTLLLGDPSVSLLDSEMFVDYKVDFDKNTEIITLKDKFKRQTNDLSKNILAEITKQQKQDKTKETDTALQNQVNALLQERTAALETEQQKELRKRFLKYLQLIEQDKLYYFMLANANPQPVLIVKSPTDNKEQKQFLGYEWSGAKGNEGIKYNGGDTVHDIITPMFDPTNPENNTKINYYIQQNFQGTPLSIPDNLQPFLSVTPLEDLLDFSRKDFDKVLSLTPKKDTFIKSKWDLIRLDQVININQKSANPADKYGSEPFVYVDITSVENETGKIDFNNLINAEIAPSRARRLVSENDILLSTVRPNLKAFGFLKHLPENVIVSTGFAVLTAIEDKILPRYLYDLLFTDIVQKQMIAKMGRGLYPSINQTDIENFKIPLPPLSIQAEIVAKCEAIDNAVNQAKGGILQANATKETLIQNVFGKYPEKKISDIALLNPSKTEIRQVDENIIISFVEMASVSDKGFIANKVDKPLKDLRKGSYTYFAENDIIIAKITPCMENGKCALATGLTNHLAMGSSEFHVIRTKGEVLNPYIFALLNRDIIRKEAEQNMTGSSGHRRVPASFYADYKIPVPPIAEQEQLLKAIEQLEAEISASQAIINAAASAKQAIMTAYL